MSGQKAIFTKHAAMLRIQTVFLLLMLFPTGLVIGGEFRAGAHAFDISPQEFPVLVNGGYLVPIEAQTRLIDAIRTASEVEVDLDAGKLTDLSTGETYALKPLGDAGEIIEAGGIFDYARGSGMLD